MALRALKELSQEQSTDEDIKTFINILLEAYVELIAMLYNVNDKAEVDNLVDTILLIIFSLMMWAFAWTRGMIVRWEGAVMIACYVAFIGNAIFRVYGV